MGFGTIATFRCLWRGGKRRAFFLSKKREGEGAAALVERDAKDGPG